MTGSVDGFAPLPIYSATAGVVGADLTGNRDGDTGADPFCHVSGRICKNCDQRIETRQPARRKGADGWVHDVCPLVID